MDDPSQLEEERCLLYVGITRAKERLYLMRAFRRSLHGSSQETAPSRFLADIPEDLMCGVSYEGQFAGASAIPSRYEQWPPRTIVQGGAKEAKASPEVPFSDGDLVRHAIFGEGVVVETKPSGDDFIVAVAFKGDAGLKRLMLSSAPLEKV